MYPQKVARWMDAEWWETSRMCFSFAPQLPPVASARTQERKKEMGMNFVILCVEGQAQNETLAHPKFKLCPPHSLVPRLKSPKPRRMAIQRQVTPNTSRRHLRFRCHREGAKGGLGRGRRNRRVRMRRSSTVDHGRE